MTSEAAPLEAWAGRAIGELRSAWGIPRLIAFDRIGSTNDVARRLAEEGAPALTTVIADLQTAGRGRFGRTWTTPPRTALLASIVLRTSGGPEAAPSAAPLRVGLAAARAIEGTTGTAVRLKWPNDIQAMDGRKLAGILCEATTAATGGYVVAGIGINVNQVDSDWPVDLRPTAVSLRELTDATMDRADLAAALIAALRADAHAIDRPLATHERAAWAARDALLGHDLNVDGEAAGTADGVTPQGALRLRTSRGPRIIWSGTVRSGTTAAAGGKGGP